MQILSFAYLRRVAENLIRDAVALFVVDLTLIDSFSLDLSLIIGLQGLFESNL